MKAAFLVVLIFSLSLILPLTGCAEKPAASSKDAIDIAKTLETADEKTSYLIKQAKYFYNSKEFQEAVKTAQYILSYVDKNSQPAKDLLEKAKRELSQAATTAVEDAKQRLGDLGK